MVYIHSVTYTVLTINISLFLQGMSEQQSLESKMSELQFELTESSQQLLTVTETNEEFTLQISAMKAELEQVNISPWFNKQ